MFGIDLCATESGVIQSGLNLYVFSCDRKSFGRVGPMVSVENCLKYNWPIHKSTNIGLHTSSFSLGYIHSRFNRRAAQIQEFQITR